MATPVQTNLDGEYESGDCPEGSWRALPLDPGSLRLLELQVREGIKTIPHHGLEIGGLITADVGASGDEYAEVAFEPLPISYKQGPRFRLADSDYPVLDEMLAPFARTGTRRVVGCYRSHLSGEVKTRAEDLALLQRACGVRGGFLMLVESAMLRGSVIYLYAGNSGSSLQLIDNFPMPEREALDVTAPKQDVALTEVPEDMNVDRPLTEIAELDLGGPVRNRKWRAVFLLLGAMAMAYFGFVGGLFTASKNRNEDIAFRVHRNGNGAELTWDVGSVPVRSAVRASITIADDNAVKRVDLDARQLRTGKYEANAKGRVLYQITFYGSDDSFFGQTKVLNELGREVRADALPPRSSGLLRSPVPRAPRNPQSDAQQDALQQLSKPSTTPRQWSVPSVVEPPPISLATTEAADQARVNLPDVLSKIAPPTPVVSPQTSSPGMKTAVPTVYAAPFPIRRVAPAIPADARTSFNGTIMVRVLVKVNAEGNVTEASVEGARGSAEKLLAPYAAQAARLWKFKPAMRDGKPVAGDAVVSFQFAK